MFLLKIKNVVEKYFDTEEEALHYFYTVMGGVFSDELYVVEHPDGKTDCDGETVFVQAAELFSKPGFLETGACSEGVIYYLNYCM